MSNEFGAVGAWVSRRDHPADREAIAAGAYDQGYRTVWLAGGLSPGVFRDVQSLLECSDSRLLVGTSVLNIWMESARECRQHFGELEKHYPGRFYLGLGVSHAPAIEGAGIGRYRRPLGMMSDYLDELFGGTEVVPRERVLLGALGPRMLDLARRRTRGALPYLVADEQVTAVRKALGRSPSVAPVLMAAVHEDRPTALSAARAHLELYLQLPNYTNNFARMGFGPEHHVDGISEELIDALYAVGTAEDVRARVVALREAGADHVALQIVPGLGLSQPESFELLGCTIDKG